MRLTPDEKALARHALGLPNDDKRSYRNRYSASPGGAAWHTWDDMNGKGAALLSRGLTLDHYSLTKDGAAAALEPGELLDEEDFSDAP